MEIKNLKIWSRKKSDRGVYACMPLKRNVPEGKKGWKLTTCPECGGKNMVCKAREEERVPAIWNNLRNSYSRDVQQKR